MPDVVKALVRIQCVNCAMHLYMEELKEGLVGLYPITHALSIGNSFCFSS